MLIFIFLIILSAFTSNISAFLSVNPNVNNITDPLGVRNLDVKFRTPQGHELVTNFELLTGALRLIRSITFSSFNAERSFQANVKLGKIQSEISTETPFPCDLSFARSQTPPTTVHELRPGDIEIIAAIGDSMSAGTCLMTESFLQILYENRGIAFSGGGYGNWRQFLTLPNILKVFNPNLYGYAVANSLTTDVASRFNVAEPTAMSRDLAHQTKLLIKRMQQDPNVDMKNHWKLVTIFMGNVDYCADLCVHDDISIPLGFHEQDLRQSLTLLRDSVPRVFVNLLPAPNSIFIFRKMKLPPHCYVIHHLFCPCFERENQTDAQLRAFEKKIHLWQEVDAYVANLDEFNTDDFTVVFHPFFTDPHAPMLPNGEVDQRLFAADCFHFSQKGHSLLANALWNSMIQPFGQKQRDFSLEIELECPTNDRPYLATKKNSRKFGV